MKCRKIAALLSAAALAATAVPFTAAGTASAAVTVNYAEALQKSMFFYEVQQCGKLPDWNMVSWRGDSMVTDVVPGGWFDAGDHLKITHTNAYTSAILAWGLLEYCDAVKKAGLYELYLNNLQWGLDYVAAADHGTKVVGLIADDAFDHVWWGSAEVYMRKFQLKGGGESRPYDEITCTSTVAQMASAMAAGYLVFKDEKPDLAASYLKHADSLFKLADGTRSNKDQGQTAGGNYYKCEEFWDDLFYAANWMYKATGEQKYLDLCESDYIGNLQTENQSTERKFTWGLCWEDLMQGGALLYAQNTGKQEWIDQIEHHLEYWTTGYGGKRVDYTPDGMAWLMQWGSCRHVTSTCWLAKLAADTVFQDDAAKAKKYDDWAKQQMEYCFGDNDLGMSYVLGMGEKNPNSFHHRTASGVWDDLWTDLGVGKEYAHVLYGALEGGPNQDGSFTDKVNAYQNTEVAIDYNAGYTAALCAMIADYGGTPLADFPPQETPKWEEFCIAAVPNGIGDSYTGIKVWAMNHSAWPTRVVKDLSYNYYFDITELVDAGLSISDVKASINYDQHAGDEGAVSISQPIQYDGNVYYVKISFNDGRVVMPTGQSEHRAEAQFRLDIADNLGVKWDPSNDYSWQGMVSESATLGNDTYMEVINHNITMYDGDTLIYGTEPDGTTAQPYDPNTRPGGNPTPPVTTTTQPIGDKILWGDADCNGEVELKDAVLLCKASAGIEGFSLSAAGKINTDLNGDGDNNGEDIAKLLKYIAGAITIEELAP